MDLISSNISLSVVSPLSELVANQLSIQIFGRSLSKLNSYNQISNKMINVMFFIMEFPDHFDPIKKVNLGLKKLPVMFLKTHSRVFVFLASFYYWKSVWWQNVVWVVSELSKYSKLSGASPDTKILVCVLAGHDVDCDTDQHNVQASLVKTHLIILILLSNFGKNS